MPYLNETQVLSSEVVEVKSSPKGKGWILVCKDFDAFLWSSSKVLKHLIPALAVWVDSQEGYALEVNRTSVDSKEFTVDVKSVKGKKVKVKWYLTIEGYSTHPKEETSDSNPFLD